MYRLLITALLTLAWLLASPSLQWPESVWMEVGASPAVAQETPSIIPRGSTQNTTTKSANTKSTKKKSAKKSEKTPTLRKGETPPLARRVGSGSIVTSNQPGFYPMRQIPPPQNTVVTGTVTPGPAVPFYPNVPTTQIIPRGATGGAGLETSQDRVIRCTHQGNLGGLSGAQQGAYIQNCAF